MSDSKARLSEAKSRIGMLSKVAPDLMRGFAGVSQAATTSGAFSPAQKEIVATAIAVTQGCEDCILYHVESARRHGATEEELVELLSVAVEMGGGPALMYAGKALEAYRSLA